MAMGRPPIPNEVKDRRGTLRKDRLPAKYNPAEVPAIRQAPPFPRGLKTFGKRVWLDIWEKTQGWIQEVDYPIIEQTARTADEIQELRRRLSRDGQILIEPIVSASGKVVGERMVPHPAAAMLRNAEKQWVKYLEILAIPPTERARLGLTKVQVQSKLERLMDARNKSTSVGNQTPLGNPGP